MIDSTNHSINNETVSKDDVSLGKGSDFEQRTSDDPMLDSTPPPIDNFETPNVSFEQSESELSTSPDTNDSENELKNTR